MSAFQWPWKVCPSKPSCTTPLELIRAIQQCGKTGDLETGTKLHIEAVTTCAHTNKYVAAVLITMYSKCHDISTVQEVFDSVKHPDVVTWNSLILAYVDNGESELALELFDRMECEPSSVTYLAALKACSSMIREKGSKKQACLAKGIAIHQRLRSKGFDSKISVSNSLVDMYSKCGSMDNARMVFNGIDSPDVVSWNSLILGYVENGECLVALDLFISMTSEPSSVTYVAALKACSALLRENELAKEFLFMKGIGIHKQAKNRGLDSDTVLANTLLDTYCKCGSMEAARVAFGCMRSRNAVSWNSLMLGYVSAGESHLALDLFKSMDCKPDYVTFVAALKACSSLANDKAIEKRFCLEKGVCVHKKLKEHEEFVHELVEANSLLDMYSNCGQMHMARSVFDGMIHEKNVVSWNTLILGYVDNGESSAAVDLLTCMDSKPDSFTYVAGLKACGSLAAIQTGRDIHARVCQDSTEEDPVVANCLIDFYLKCDKMSMAEALFDTMQAPSTVSWNTLISGYSSLGDSFQVFRLAKEMQESGVSHNSITYKCLLMACSHTGMVDEAAVYFQSMLLSGSTSVSIDHYNSMVDVLGRANKLEEALALIKSMPFKADAVTWTTLLGACKKWNNVKVGKVAFDSLEASGAKTAAQYVMMSNICKVG